MSEPIEVELDDGVLSFDGRVVEGFGFGRHEARRVHISKVSKVEKPEAATLAELERFVDAVRSAAPNVQQ
jgi:hypothetical protein